MKITTTLLVAALFLGVSLAGCAGTPDTGAPTPTTPTMPTQPTVQPTGEPVPITPPEEPPATVDETTYTVNVTGFPKVIEVGKTFNFTVNVSGDIERETDHVGAHYGNTSTMEPSTTVYGGACAHGAIKVPGAYVVECTFETEGTHYVRGHMRLNESGTLYNYWSEELNLTVRGPVGNYTLSTDINPVLTPLTAGSNLTFNLTISGSSNDTSDHIGAHYGLNSTTMPSTTVYNMTCDHKDGTVPGTHMVKCHFAEAGTYYLRGHMRISAGPNVYNFWSTERQIVVV